MLSGIRTGKRKAKVTSDVKGTAKHSTTSVEGSPSTGVDHSNAFAAAELRSLFQSGRTVSSFVGRPAENHHKHQQQQQPQQGKQQQQKHGLNDWKESSRDMNRITRLSVDESSDHSSFQPSNRVVLVNPSHDWLTTVKVQSQDGSRTPSFAAMLAQERSESDRDTQAILRNCKKRRKLYEGMDDDDEAFAQMEALLTDKNVDGKKLEERERTRQLARFDQQQQIISKCWWWLEASGSFQKHRLLALGDHVSLVWTPANLAVAEGQHFYLVPVKTAPSLTSCDEEVWSELYRFQSSLAAMFQPNTVIFTETVLPRSNSFWQTRMEVMVIPKSVGQDAPLFFKTALAEEAEEWGTHNQLLYTAGKGLRRTIPANFSYFYVQYGDVFNSNAAGMVQIIEGHTFPRDFAINTVLGMMRQDPLRFRHKVKDNERHEKEEIQKFLSKWRDFDWTQELD